MNQRHILSGQLVVFVGLLVIAAQPANAQLIALKTVPVATGDQFILFPSHNLGMGSVGIAIDDSIADPFSNPAKGARIREAHVFASPTYYSVSDEAGSAGALPVGALFKSSRVFGGGMVSLQQVSQGDWFRRWWGVPDVLPPNALRSQSSTNKYGFLMFGAVLPGDVAVAASTFLADFNAIDGVEHLYANSAAIEQSGDLKGVRLGAVKTFEGDRSLEGLVLYRRFHMQHDVTYVDWLPIDTLTWQQEFDVRKEENLDVTDTWGIHLGYVQPIGTRGWRIGGTLTGNWKSHPKIPNYEIMNIPRDPGNSTAFDLGVGIAKVVGPTTFGIDIVYEPGSSDTWAEAEGPVETVSGDTIRTGEKTVENAFSFSNAFVNVGITRQVGPAAFQFGVGLRSYDYHLDQWDHVEEDTPRQDEQWMEWVPSWGARVSLGDLEVRYAGRVTTGTGRPGVGWRGGGWLEADVAAPASMGGNDILLAPSGILTLDDVTVMTHQFSISVPIR
jgi:hypothetical protein